MILSLIFTVNTG